MNAYRNVFHHCSSVSSSVAVMARQSAGIPLKKSMKPMLMAVQEALATSAASQASKCAPTRCTRVVIYTDCAQDFTEVYDIASEGVPRDWTSRPQRGRSSLCQPFACMENCCISFALFSVLVSIGSMTSRKSVCTVLKGIKLNVLQSVKHILWS